ncbi:MAG: hypothetical protein LAO21_12230 [Acidobacteriia bacterium]|nr:hypothetical protein [Terriglobia bacterium]
MCRRSSATRLAVYRILGFLIISLVLTTEHFAATVPTKTPKKNGAKSLLAYVFDDRFSVVRSRPDVEAPFLRRLRVGHRVFLPLGGPPSRNVKYRRVVVSRKFSGWILAAAVVAPGLPGDDERLFRHAASQSREKAMIALKILTTHFDRTPLHAAALLRLGQLAEEEAGQLSVEANRKLAREERSLPEGLDEKELFANYRGLDRWASNGVRFIYHREKDRFVYHGEAYREIIRKFPGSPEAASARGRLAGIEDALRN